MKKILKTLCPLNLLLQQLLPHCPFYLLCCHVSDILVGHLAVALSVVCLWSFSLLGPASVV